MTKQQIVMDALKYFGPMNARQIKEKLALRSIEITDAELADALKDVRYATGFDELTYKV